jgi:hypothetical protein
MICLAVILNFFSVMASYLLCFRLPFVGYYYIMVFVASDTQGRNKNAPTTKEASLPGVNL